MIGGESNTRASGGRLSQQDKLSSLDLETLISLRDRYGRKLKRMIEKQIKERMAKGKK